MKKNLTFAVIGAGHFGRHYIRLLQNMPGAELRAVADRSLETIEKNISAPAVSVRQCSDAQEIFSDSEIDCAVIATPAASHCRLVRSALEQGKHVLVEKPMAINMEEAEQIRAAVQKSGRAFMAGHQYLYNDYIRHLKKKLDEGMLGSIKCLFAEHLYFGPIRSDIGCFQESAAHELSVIDYLFSPGEITDVKGSKVDFSGMGRDDFTSASVRFASGLTVVITVSWFAPEKVRRMTIAGDRGMAVFDERRDEKLKFFLHPYPSAPAAAGRDGSSQFLNFSKNEIVIPAISATEPLRNQLEHFISCVQTGAEPASGITHGIRITTMLDAINQRITGDAR